MWKRWIFQKNSDLLIAGSSLKWKTFVQFDLWKFSVYLWKLHVWENSPSSDIYQNPPTSHPIKLQDSSISLKGIHGYPSWKYLPRERTIWDYYFWLGVGNSMSNHPGHDTLTSQILLIFLLFVDNVETINPWKFQTSTSYGSKVIKIWKFDWNGCSILNLRFL